MSDKEKEWILTIDEALAPHVSVNEALAFQAIQKKFVDGGLCM